MTLTYGNTFSLLYDDDYLLYVLYIFNVFFSFFIFAFLIFATQLEHTTPDELYILLLPFFFVSIINELFQTNWCVDILTWIGVN